MIDRSGREHSIDDSAAPIRDGNGVIQGVILIFRDNTEQREAQRHLQRSESELADFFDNASVGLHWAGPDGTVLRVNRAELEMLGYSRDEYVGRNVVDFHVDRELIGDILRRLASR